MRYQRRELAMMPWRDQLRIGWRALQWVTWPGHRHTWANAAELITTVAMTIAIYAQDWLGLLAGFFLCVAVGYAGRKRSS
jgi:hypothetical protein